MSSNRRGFIGIFSQNHDQDDTHETDDESASAEASADRQERNESTRGDVESKSSTDSDWDDIFDDGPRNVFSPASEPPSVNPVAAAMASKPSPETDPPASSPSNDALKVTSESNETVKETTGTETADQNTNQPSKAMHNGPSSKSILSKSDRQAVTDAIQTLREKLSFARQANADQRDGLLKLGTTGREFISQATKVVRDNPDVLPRSFDDECFVNDAELVEALRNIGDDLRELTQRVADTESKIASSAFAGALLVHRCGSIDADKGKSEPYHKSTASPTNGSTHGDHERNGSSMNRVGA